MIVKISITIVLPLSLSLSSDVWYQYDDFYHPQGILSHEWQNNVFKHTVNAQKERPLWDPCKTIRSSLLLEWNRNQTKQNKRRVGINWYSTWTVFDTTNSPTKCSHFCTLHLFHASGKAVLAAGLASDSVGSGGAAFGRSAGSTVGLGTSLLPWPLKRVQDLKDLHIFVHFSLKAVAAVACTFLMPCPGQLSPLGQGHSIRGHAAGRFGAVGQQ